MSLYSLRHNSKFGLRFNINIDIKTIALNKMAYLLNFQSEKFILFFD